MKQSFLPIHMNFKFYKIQNCNYMYLQKWHLHHWLTNDIVEEFSLCWLTAMGCETFQRFIHGLKTSRLCLLGSLVWKTLHVIVWRCAPQTTVPTCKQKCEQLKKIDIDKKLFESFIKAVDNCKTKIMKTYQLVRWAHIPCTGIHNLQRRTGGTLFPCKERPKAMQSEW